MNFAGRGTLEVTRLRSAEVRGIRGTPNERSLSSVQMGDVRSARSLAAKTRHFYLYLVSLTLPS